MLSMTAIKRLKLNAEYLFAMIQGLNTRVHAFKLFGSVSSIIFDPLQ